MPTIQLVVLQTNLTEEQLFLRLVGRGSHADVPFYFSVGSYNWDEGWVTFTRLDCAPAYIFRVGVAGSSLVFSINDHAEITSWLNEWKVRSLVAERKEFSSPEEARAFLEQLRREKKPAVCREIIGRRIAETIRKAAEAKAEDETFMASWRAGTEVLMQMKEEDNIRALRASLGS